ncbi:MAG: tyrosine-protein phosphatase [Oscillospiraceae bacterium]
MSLRRYPFSQIMNMRDIGGYPVPGGQIAYKKFFRSAAPLGFTEEEERLLQGFPLTDVIDLRGSAEVEQAPNAFEKNREIILHHISFMGNIKDYPKSDDFVPTSYLQVAEDSNMLQVLRVCLRAKGAVLFHCSAGKDRTGTVAALLEMLAGADDDDIVGDYILSQAYMRRQLEIFAKERPYFPMCLIYPRIENIEGFLRLFHEKYETPQAYFQKIGLSESEIRDLKEKLTDNT